MSSLIARLNSLFTNILFCHGNFYRDVLTVSLKSSRGVLFPPFKLNFQLIYVFFPLLNLLIFLRVPAELQIPKLDTIY